MNVLVVPSCLLCVLKVGTVRSNNYIYCLFLLGPFQVAMCWMMRKIRQAELVWLMLFTCFPFVMWKQPFFFTATLYLQDITLIHQIGVNKVKNISQPHMDHDFVTFQHYMPRLSVYQMSPQTACFFYPATDEERKSTFFETVWVAPSCSPPRTRWESPLTEITETRWRKASSCLQALHRRQQGTSCCMPPCCFFCAVKAWCCENRWGMYAC